jgi:WD40 repeat protein/uncharacterized caspase-like protein
MPTASYADSDAAAPRADAIAYEAWLRLETGQHSGPVQQLQVTPDGHTLVSAGDCTLRVWDVATRQCLRVLRGQIGPGVDDTPGHGQVLRFAISRDSRWVVALKSWRVTDPDRRAALTTEFQVFDLTTGNLQTAFSHTGRWMDLDFSPNGRWLLLAGCGPAGPRCRATLQSFLWADVLRASFGQMPAATDSAAFGPCDDSPGAPDERPGPGTVAARFVPVARRRGSDLHIVVALNAPPRNGRSTGRLCWASLSATGSLSVQRRLRLKAPIEPATLALSPNFAAVAGRNIAGEPPAPVLCHDHRGALVASKPTESGPSALAFSPSGSQLIVGFHAHGRPNFRTVQVNVYDTAGGAFLIKSTYYGHDDSIAAVAFCADGTALSCGGDNQALHFWDASHRVGAAVAALRGAGRTLWNAGVDAFEQIGFGAIPARQLPAQHAIRQQRFDLLAMALHTACPSEGDGCDSESAKWLLRADAPGLTIPLRCVAAGSEPAAPPDLTLFVGTDDEWVVFSRSGYYDASPRGDRHFGYHVNRGAEREALFLPSDRFSAVFYRPDIIRAIVEHGSEDRARAQGVHIPAVDVTAVLPPLIELASGRPRVRDGQVTLRFKVESLCPGNPAQRVWVLQNERFAWAAPELSASGHYKVTLSLRPGANSFTLLANGPLSRALPVLHSVQGPAAGIGDGSGDTVPGKLFLLCVGVSQFAAAGSPAAGNFKPLKFAHKDAIALLNALGKSRNSSRVDPRVPFSNKAFAGVQASLLINEQATKAAVMRELQTLCAQIQAREKTHKAERDVLFVFLSGHGVRMKDSPELYFWNHDLDPRADTLAETGLSLVELGEIATAVPAEVVIAVDACHSGMAGANALAGLDAEELARRMHAVNERGIYVMNAARSEELAHEDSTEGHGFFTRAVLTALRLEKSLLAEEAGVKGRALSMLGLIAAVQELVPYYTMKQQTSVFRMYGDLLPLTIYQR